MTDGYNLWVHNGKKAAFFRAFQAGKHCKNTSQRTAFTDEDLTALLAGSRTGGNT